MNATANVACVVHRPARPSWIISTSSCQVGALGPVYAQGNVSCIGVRDCRGAGNLGAVWRRLENGSDFSNALMLRIARRIGEPLCQTIAQVRTQGRDVVTAVLNAIIIKLLRHGIRAAINTWAAAGTDILKGWR